MKITILVDDKPAREVIHDDLIFAVSLAHQALTAIAEETTAAALVELVERAPAAAATDAPAPAPDVAPATGELFDEPGTVLKVDDAAAVPPSA